MLSLTAGMSQKTGNMYCYTSCRLSNFHFMSVLLWITFLYLFLNIFFFLSWNPLAVKPCKARVPPNGHSLPTKQAGRQCRKLPKPNIFLKKIKDFFFFFLQNCSGFISCVGNRPHLNTSRFRLKQLSARINTITEALGVSSGVPPHPTFNPVF